MMTCRWIVLCGIIFTSVDSDSDIPPHQEEPLKKLLKRTINHVKSFLGEFEKKIKRSRLLVNEIHSQSLINITATNRNYLRTVPLKSSSFIRYPESPFTVKTINRAFELRPQNSGIESNPGPNSPNISHVDNIVRRVDSNIKYPTDLPRFKTKSEPNIFFGQIETSLTRNKNLFTLKSIPEEEVRFNLGLVHTDTNQGINGVAMETIATTKHLKRLMRQGPARFQPEEEYILHKRYLDMLSGGTANNSVRITKYPKSLIQPGPAMFQPPKELSFKLNKTKPVVMLKSFTFNKRSFFAPKYPKPLMRQSQIEHKIDANSEITKGLKELIRRLEIFENPINTKEQDPQKLKISTTTQKNKLRTRTNKQENNNYELSTIPRKQVTRKHYLSTGTVPREIKKVVLLNTNFKEKEYLPTLPKSYFQLKQDIINAPKLDYPDIFSKSTFSRSAVTRPTSTKKQLILFTTRSPKEFTSGIIPEPAKDYQNINFRASNLYEHSEPKKQRLKEKFNAVKSKSIIAPTVSAAINKMKNEKLRKIIAASSYSLSDEETYLKVNLLDQLYHYNKNLTI